MNNSLLFHSALQLSQENGSILLTDSTFRPTCVFYVPLLLFSHFFISSLFVYLLPTLVEERVVGPRDLQVSELAHSSLRLTWSQATGDVTGYRLLVTPFNSKGHLLPLQQRQVMCYACA